MWILGLVILLLAWIFSFKVLPESVASGSSGAFYVPVKAENEMLTFVRIFVWNLFVCCMPIMIGNLARLKGVPFGYFLVLYNWAMYGVLLGTNSFIIPGPGRFLPSIITLFYGSGIYEISSYTLISSATFNLVAFHEESSEGVEQQGKLLWRSPKLSRNELILTALGILILAVSNYYEAIHIFHA